MEQKHRNILQTSFAYLIKNLHNVEEVCDHLVTDEILTSGMMDSIKHKKPRPSGQTRELLSILPRRGTKAYDSFINALEESANTDVAEYLREKEGSKGTGKNSQNAGKPDDESKKPKGENEDIQKTSTQHSENPDKKNKLESANSNQGHEDWPDLKKRLEMVKKRDMPMCTKESFTKICESRQVYHMTGEKKGKYLSISNVQCIQQNTDKTSPDDTQSKETNDQSKETDSLQSKETDSLQSKETDSLQSKETDSLQSKETDSLQSKETDSLQSKETNSLQSKETNHPQSVKTDNPQQNATDCGAKCRSRVDFDKTAILQLFKHMQYESKGADVIKDVSGDDMKTFLKEHLNKENSAFDSLVIVIFSGGDKYKPGKIYDKDGNEIENTEIFSIIQESTAFAGKPKIVIIRTYNFEEETETYDVLDAEKQELHFYDTKPNNKDLFVVSSQPRTKKGPWIIGEGMNGSYFIQALIHVFKKMAHEKSFLEMMKEVNDCLIKAMVPVNGTSALKEPVAEVMILEHSMEKELFFFPGFKTPAWPDLAAGASTLKKKDLKQCSQNFYEKIQKERKIYPMTSVKRGKFILISNAQCNCECEENQTAEDLKKKEERYKEGVMNSDFDKSNISQLFKFMGYDTTGGMLNKKTKEEIKDVLTRKLNEIDSDQTVMYDSLVIMFLSGKFDSEPGKIYDCNGDVVSRKDILDIMKANKHFKGKPKLCIVQTYNFQESKPYDATDSSAVNEIIKDGHPNKDDIFMVSSYPRIEQGPWIIGDNMSGSYFIQALIHAFKNSACEKSFIDLLKEANTCLLQAVVPNKKDGTVDKTSVAQIVLLEYCEEKELYFFPGLSLKALDFSASMLGNVVSQPTD